MNNRSYDSKPDPIVVDQHTLHTPNRSPRVNSPKEASPVSGEKLVPSRWSPSGWRYINNEMRYLQHPNRKNYIHPRPAQPSTEIRRWETTN